MSVTPPLDEFRKKYAQDDNEWWYLSGGDMQNLFEEACEQLDAVCAKVAELESRIRADERDESEPTAEQVEEYATALRAKIEAEIRANERERIADLIQMKFGVISARGHDSGCVCSVCVLTRMVDDIVDWLKKGGSDG